MLKLLGGNLRFESWIISLLELWSWNVLHGSFKCMHRLFRWQLLRLYRVKLVYSLPSWLLSIVDGVWCVYGLLIWDLSGCSRLGHLFELPQWLLSILHGCKFVRRLRHKHLLDLHRLHCFHGLLELRCIQLLCNWIIELRCQLPCWYLQIRDWFRRLLRGVPIGNILCLNWRYSLDCLLELPGWVLLHRGVDYLQQLQLGDVRVFVWIC